jgi:uncharacterized membrane protein
MADDIGPVQLIVFGFDQPKFGGGVAAEMKRLNEQGTVRLIDALVVHKSANGDIDTRRVTELSMEEAEKFGGIVGALLGLGAGGETGMIAGAEAGMETVAEQGGHLFSEEQTWDVLEDIPNDTAAAIVLLEHRWAIPLRDAIRAEGGRAIGDLWLTPGDMVAAGILAAEAREESRAA